MQAQLVNVNPDPKGKPWFAGGLTEFTPELQAELDSIPMLELTEQSMQTTLPTVVDNSQEIFFPPITSQDNNGSCAQVSGVYYNFTYEINRLRNLPANDIDLTQNQYPVFYTYNYFNNGNLTEGTFWTSGWNTIRDCGVPTVEEWGGIYGSHLKWMTGYNIYESALQNRVLLDAKSINVSTPEGLTILKHWLNDHSTGAEKGGVATFGANVWRMEYGTIPDNSPESGKSYIKNWGPALGHAMTIVGYNDNILLEVYDPETNSMVMEYGAVKIANSWGPNWPEIIDEGFVYVPYRLLGLLPYTYVHVIELKESHTPKITMQIKVQHPTLLCKHLFRYFPK